MAQSQVSLAVSRYLDVLGSNLPIDERISLSRLSPSDVPAWADARIEDYRGRVEDYRRRIKEIEGYITTFHSLRNTQSSIHVLPSELLAKIFVYACTTRRDLQIARVCRHWNAVITSTPHVWANVIESVEQFYCAQQATDQHFLRAALAKSGSLPLTIATTYSFHRAWNILSPYSFRLVSFTVYTDEDSDIIEFAAALSSGSLLNLRTLRATCGDWLQQQLSLDSRYLPHLRELYIAGVLLTSTLTVSTLEDLTIIGEVREPWHVLGQALQRCVALKTLVLLTTMPEEWALRAVSLPQLLNVTVRDQANHSRKMLHCLHIPSTTAVNIMMNDSDGDTFLDAVPHDYMQRFHTQSPIDHLHIYLLASSSYRTSARCHAGGQERLHIVTYIHREHDLQGFLEALFGACELGALHTLAIDMTLYTLPLTSWNLLFQRPPHLRRLELLSRTSHAVRVHFAGTFLRDCGNTASSGLTLAWVVALAEDDADETDVLRGLDALASVLEGAATRCGRLELYAAKWSKKQQEFQSLAAIPTDPDLFRMVAARILPRLASLVDVLTIH